MISGCPVGGVAIIKKLMSFSVVVGEVRKKRMKSLAVVLVRMGD